jgi:hypothetical protein
MPQLVFIHVVISLPGAWSGIVVLFGFFGNKRLDAARPQPRSLHHPPRLCGQKIHPA